MMCIERIVKFINRNAYVYIAVTGKDFCSSAASATALIVKNVAKVVALNFVAELTLFLSKIIVSGCVSLVSYAIMIRYPGIFSAPITSRFVIVVNDLIIC
jgi:choline transporter-like protein 2/4/5